MAVAVMQLFFDNERVNCTEVAQLGVVCIYTPHGVSSHSKKAKRGLEMNLATNHVR